MLGELRRNRRWRLFTLLGPAGLWLALFFLAPLLVVVGYSFATRGAYGLVVWSFTLENYARLLDPDYLHIFLRSFGFATLTTIICLAIGYPMAYYIVRRDTRIRTLLLFLVVIPFWTNLVVRTYAWKVLLNHNGVINSFLRSWGFESLALINTPTAVMIGLIYTALPFMVLPLYASLERFDFSLLEAANDLGAGYFRAFTQIMVPMTFPGILVGSVLVFIPSVGNFIIPDILGGSRVAMLGNTVALMFGSGQNWPFGSVLALLFTFLLIGGLLIYFRTLPEEDRL